MFCGLKTYFADTNTLNHRLMRSAPSVLIFSVLWLIRIRLSKDYHLQIFRGVWTDIWNKIKILDIEKSNKRAYV